MPRHHTHALFAYMSEVCVYRRPTQVQLMRGEFLETALYWVEVVFVGLGAIAEKKVSQYCCVCVSVWVQQHSQSAGEFHTAVRACINKFVHVVIHRVI